MQQRRGTRGQVPVVLTGFKPSGKSIQTHDIAPKAGAADFDDTP